MSNIKGKFELIGPLAKGGRMFVGVLGQEIDFTQLTLPMAEKLHAKGFAYIKKLGSAPASAPKSKDKE